MAELCRTIIVGLGNPLLTDDSVGVQAARRLAANPDLAKSCEIIELYAGGLRLLDAVAGFEQAVIIDAMVSGRPAGTLTRLPLADTIQARTIVSSHDTCLVTALEFGRRAGMLLPQRFLVYGIEAADVATFSEELTPAVAAALPGHLLTITRELQEFL